MLFCQLDSNLFCYARDITTPYNALMRIYLHEPVRLCLDKGEMSVARIQAWYWHDFIPTHIITQMFQSNVWIQDSFWKNHVLNGYLHRSLLMFPHALYSKIVIADVASTEGRRHTNRSFFRALAKIKLPYTKDALLIPVLKLAPPCLS